MQATEKDLEQTILTIARRAREAALKMAPLDEASKNRALEAIAQRIESNAETIIEENARDLAAARALDLSRPMIERLTLTPERIEKMLEGIHQVIALKDPVGAVLEQRECPNGLIINRLQVPIGVIGIIYESRPNVTIDCAVLCLKSGNAAILRGGKEAFHTNTALAGHITHALEASDLPNDAIQIIPTTDRWALNALLKMDDYIHCIIPRGGESLIRFVAENSRIPVIKHYTGVCSIYVDAEAEAEMAENIVINAKTQRVSVCNAAENLYIHREAATTLLPRLATALSEHKVELRVDASAAMFLSDFDTVEATEDDFRTEYLDYIIAIKVVDSVDEAISEINHHGSGHSDAIVTNDEVAAQRFLAGVDSATVYWNASTRFTDGYEFGLGAEIGISTDRLHARGPMGLNELCTYKYVITGNGQIR